MFSVAFHFFYGPLVYVRFNGHFPGGFVLAGTRMSPFWILLELRMKEVEPEDVQSSSQIVATNKPTPNIFTHRMVFLSPNQQRHTALKEMFKLATVSPRTDCSAQECIISFGN